MRYLVLSDIHANLEALDAVLAAVTPDSYDRLLVLGDLVGYGADPNEVITRVRALAPHVLIRGNHDKVACGLDDATGFNAIARRAAEWTAEVLTPENRRFLVGLPEGPTLVDDDIEVCHGAPFDEDVYIFGKAEAARAFDAMERPLCLFGHTHIPAVFRAEASGKPVALADPHVTDGRTTLPLEEGVRYLINVGSVGQPRDGDPRAACGLYDGGTRELSLMRVPYQVDVAQRKIVEAGLPQLLSDRLGMGR